MRRVILVLALLSLGCSDNHDPIQVCDAGARVPCECTVGVNGFQECTEDRSEYRPCNCAPETADW